MNKKIRFQALSGMSCHKMALWSTMKGLYSQASSPVLYSPLFWVIREEMTHETLLLLLCRQLWLGFTEQLTVNWPFSSANHLIVSAASRISPTHSLQCCVRRRCFNKRFIVCLPRRWCNTAAHPHYACCHVCLGWNKTGPCCQKDSWWNDDGRLCRGHEHFGGVHPEGTAGPRSGADQAGGGILAVQLALQALHLHKLQGSP